MVSYDAGLSYQCEAESDDIGCLLDKADDMGLDDRMLRWVIEDDRGDIKEASLMHKRIIGFMKKANKKW